MHSEKKLLVLTASNGNNLKLGNRFLESSKVLGVNSTLIDLTSLDLPLFCPQKNSELGIPKKIKTLTAEMLKSEYWIICSPEYNGSIPPVLTNTIAWLSVQDDDFRKLFNGRPIAMASFSGGCCIELLISLRIQLTHLGAQVVGRQLASNHNTPAKDESIKDILLRLLQMQPLNI